MTKEAWIPLPSEDEVRATFGSFDYDYGFLPRMTRLIFAHPQIGDVFGQLTSAIMFGSGRLSRPEREMISAVAAAAQDCTYCADNHAEFLRAEGANADIVEAIKKQRWRELDTMSEREQALCEVAEKISAMPNRFMEKDWQRLRDLGFDDLALLEVAHIVGVFNHLTRLASAFGLDLDPVTLDAAESQKPLQRRQQ